MTEPSSITRALLAAIRHSVEPMVLSDPGQPHHPIIAVNAPFTALTGYPAEETVGRNCSFLQGPGTDPATPLRIRRCLADGRGCVEWIVNHRRDGSRFWNLLFIVPVFDRAGGLLHFLGNQRDITAGVPTDVPDYTLGKADLPPALRREFDALVDVLAAASPGTTEPAAGAQTLVHVTEMARRIGGVTTGLAPAAWAPPP